MGKARSSRQCHQDVQMPADQAIRMEIDVFWLGRALSYPTEPTLEDHDMPGTKRRGCGVLLKYTPEFDEMQFGPVGDGAGGAYWTRSSQRGMAMESQGM